MNRSFLSGIYWLAMAGCTGTLLAVPAAQQCDAAAPAAIRIVNPESTGVTWSYLIDGQTQTLQAGYSQQIDSACTITFDRGGGLGQAKYDLTGGTYTLTDAKGHWELYRSENKAAVASAPEQGTSSAPSISTMNSGPAIPAVGREAQGTPDVSSLAATITLTPERAAIRDEPVTLFNGQDLSGWSIDGGNSEQWRIEDGVIVAQSTSWRTRNYILSNQEFSDFTLRFEFQVGDDSSHGAVALRAVVGEKVPMNDKSQVFDHPIIKLTRPNRDPKEATGTAHWLSVAAPYTSPAMRPKIEIGRWHRCEVTVQGEHCTANFDGVPCVDLTLDAQAPRPFNFTPGLARDKGKVGFQMNTGTMRFRNISITPLSSASGQPTQPVAAVQVPVAQPQVVSEEDKRMFWAMYRDAGLDKATLKTVSDDWKSKTGPQRKVDYDSFMKQVEEMRQSASKPAAPTNDLP